MHGNLTNATLIQQINGGWRITLVVLLLGSLTLTGWLELWRNQPMDKATSPPSADVSAPQAPPGSTSAARSGSASSTTAQGGRSMLMAIPTATIAPTPTATTITAIQVTPLKQLKMHSSDVTGVAISPNGHTIASSGRDGVIQLWTPDQADPPSTLSDDGGDLFSLVSKPEVGQVAFSPDGSLIAAGYSHEVALVYQIADRERILQLKGHTAAVLSVVWSPDGRTIATSSSDGTIRLWNARDGSPKQVLRGHTSYVSRIAFSPDGTKIASVSRDRSLRIWDATDGSLLHKIEQANARGFALAWSPDSLLVAHETEDSKIQVWRASDGTLATTLDPRNGQILLSLAWSPNGQILVALSRYELQFWNMRTETVLSRIDAQESIMIALSADGQRLVSGGNDGWIRAWDIRYDPPF